MKEWYSAKELAGLPGVPGTERAIQIGAEKQQWQSRPRAGKGGGREYHLTSLPEETRTHLLTESVPLDTSGQDLEAYLSSRRISLSPAELQDPVIQAKLTCSKAYEACPAYKGREKVLAALAARYGKSTQQIRRWISDVDKLRVKSKPRITLADEKIDIPASHTFSPEALAYGLSVYARNMRGGIKAAYNEMTSLADQRNWRVGDYSNFTRMVKKVPEIVWTRIYRGDTGFELACVPKIIKEWTAVPVQSVICGDQKIFDYEVYDSELQRVIIPNGYFWMDCSSRMITGTWISVGHYNSYTVGNALREALRFGIPDEIFTDWGKPEGAKYIGNILSNLSGHAQTGDFQGMAERFADMSCDDVKHRKAQPGKPWMKPIENIMNILDTMMDARFIGGFRKRNNDAWANKQIQAMLKRDRKVTFQTSRPMTAAEARGLMNIEEFIHTVFSVVEEHNRTQKKLQEGGVIIPGEFFSRGLKSQSRNVLPKETLNYICMPYVERIPRQSVVRFKVGSDDERGYYSPALAGLHEKVRVSFNPYNRDEPAVLMTQDGQYMGLADPWHVQNPYDRAGMAIKRSRQAELMKWVGEQADRVKKAFGIVIEDVPAKEMTEITRIIPASTIAHEAEKERKVYEIRKDNTTLHERETAREANRLRDGLKERFTERAAAAVTFVIPSDEKARYMAYLELAERFSSGGELSPEEEAFHSSYPGTDGYRNQVRFHQRFPDLYIKKKTVSSGQETAGQVVELTGHDRI